MTDFADELSQTVVLKRGRGRPRIHPVKRKGERMKPGPKIGTRTRVTLRRDLKCAEAIERALSEDVTPLDVMMMRMKGDLSVTDAQFEAAIALAPYLHPKLTATAFVDATPKQAPIDLSQCTAEELAVLRKVTMRSLEAGRASPKPMSGSNTMPPVKSMPHKSPHLPRTKASAV